MRRSSRIIGTVVRLHAVIFTFGVVFCMGQADAGSQTRFGLVVDNSGAFRLGLERAVRIGSGIVDSDRLAGDGFIVTFSDASNVRMRQELTADRAELRDAIENMYAEPGGGALVAGIELAAKQLIERAETGDRGYLVVFASGEERVDRAGLDDLVKVLQAAKIPVYAIVITNAKLEGKFLDRLTKETGGKKYMPGPAEDLDAFVESLVSDIANRINGSN